MRIFSLSFAVIVCTHAQEVAKPSSVVAFATSGQFVISTRNTAPPGQKAQTEVYEVITGKDGSAALTLGALGGVKMEPNTQIRMPAASAPQSLELLKGRLFLNIDAGELKKSQNSEFRLKTPAALLAVKGTQFFLDASPSQETLGVHEGAVAIVTQALHSIDMLQKGQVSSYGPAEALHPRAMSAEEQVLSSQYNSTLPLKTPVTMLVVGGTSGIAEYLRDGQPTTIAQNDIEEISKLGASVMVIPDASSSVRLELTEKGMPRLISTRTRDATLSLRLKLTLRQPAPANAAALRFYLRSGSSYSVSVEGKSITLAAPSSAQEKSQLTRWHDCLLDLHPPQRTRTDPEYSFSVELMHTPNKNSSKQNATILEFSDFMLLSAPAAP